MKISNGETESEMEENQDNRVVANGLMNEHWFWAAASTAQLGWGVATLKKGYAGHSTLMPLKAFAVASLFVGAASTAAVATLHLSGIHSVSNRALWYLDNFVAF